jgi:hypothetical protein
MSEADSLATFEFPKSKGLFLSFANGDEIKVRVLTTDPVVSTQEFEGDNGAVSLSTKFAFIVYNWTDKKAQIMNVGTTIAKEIQRIHQDKDFGANIRNVDIKISARGEKLQRTYSVNVLPKAEELTNEQIKEAQEIDLEKIVKGSRMSLYNPDNYKSQNTGYESAKAIAEKMKNPEDDVVIDPDDDDAPIDLNDIPF